uniref:Uncharacterized protein n=1 Tax=Solanum tuberosum TaxID=4113 RepID=M1DPV5_SOLTU
MPKNDYKNGETVGGLVHQRQQGTPEATRNFLAFWYAGEEGEHMGVPDGSQESSMVRKKKDSGEGNEAGATAYGFWIYGG